MEAVKLMYPYYSSSPVSENRVFPFTLQVTTSELIRLYSAAMDWSIFSNIFMFISASPTTMKIVSLKQTIAPLRHPEHVSFYCHAENQTLWMRFFHLARACLFIRNFLQTSAQNTFFCRLKLRSIKQLN